MGVGPAVKIGDLPVRWANYGRSSRACRFGSFWSARLPVHLLDNQQVKTVQVKDDVVTMELWEPYQGSYTVSYKLPSFELFYRDFNDTIVKQHANGIIQAFDYPAGFRLPAWASALAWRV